MICYLNERYLLKNRVTYLQPKLADEDGQFQTITTKKAQHKQQRPQSEKKQSRRHKEEIPDMSIEDYVYELSNIAKRCYESKR
jgi:replication initiation and membrane attachment protein DnaB